MLADWLQKSNKIYPHRQSNGRVIAQIALSETFLLNLTAILEQYKNKILRLDQ